MNYLGAYTDHIPQNYDYPLPVKPTPSPDYVQDHEAVFTYLAQLGKHNDFARGCFAYYAKHGVLSPAQLAACERSLAKRAQKAPAAMQAATPAAFDAPDAIDLRALPSGLYAVPGDDTRLKVQIDNLTEGKWAGWVFVKDGAEYGHGKRYGSQKPAQVYVGDVKDALRVIAANPAEASAAYGRLVGRCGLCGRKLEDETSVARGIGPVCAAKYGW